MGGRPVGVPVRLAEGTAFPPPGGPRRGAVPLPDRGSAGPPRSVELTSGAAACHPLPSMDWFEAASGGVGPGSHFKKGHLPADGFTVGLPDAVSVCAAGLLLCASTEKYTVEHGGSLLRPETRTAGVPVEQTPELIARTMRDRHRSTGQTAPGPRARPTACRQRPQGLALPSAGLVSAWPRRRPTS